MTCTWPPGSVMLAPTFQKPFGRELSAHMKTSTWIRREDWALDTHAGLSDGRRPGCRLRCQVEMMPRGAKRDERFVHRTAFNEVLILTVRIHFGLQVGEFF